MAGLLVPPQLFFIDENGAPLAGGTLGTYVPGTSTPKNTWQDAAETIFNTNPITLDDRGACEVYADGDVRLILSDSNGVGIFDLLASEPLPASAISAVVLPILGALTLQQFRDLAGITSAISTAISAIQLMPGPTGPLGATGPTGIQGATGPTGPAGGGGGGGGGTTAVLWANPGWWVDNTTGFLIQFGFASTFGTGGFLTVNFARPYVNVPIVLANTGNDPVGSWASVSGTTNTAFNVLTTSPLFPSPGPAQFWWISVGV